MMAYVQTHSLHCQCEQLLAASVLVAVIFLNVPGLNSCNILVVIETNVTYRTFLYC